MVEREAANIIALTQTESAIKGGLNTPLVGNNIGDFTGVTPQRQVKSDVLNDKEAVCFQMAQTPNLVLGTPRNEGVADGGFTPVPRTPGGVGATGATPMRDTLKINQETDSMCVTARLYWCFNKIFFQLQGAKDGTEGRTESIAESEKRFRACCTGR